tara:strand:- start:145 stop:405 length:261 start_codon:yes stop_codon:yes gene_type:complete
MGKRTVNKLIKVGQLIKWFEPYADGFMTKDCGHGIVLDITEHAYPGMEKYKMYNVYRNKHNDTMKFNKNELELFDLNKENKNEQNR